MLLQPAPHTPSGSILTNAALSVRYLMKRHCAFLEPGASFQVLNPGMRWKIQSHWVALPHRGDLYFVKKDHFGNVMKCTTSGM
jgi:hypothetical protein